MKKALIGIVMVAGLIYADTASEECKQYIRDAHRVGQHIIAYQDQYRIKMRNEEEFRRELEISLYVINEKVALSKCDINKKGIKEYMKNLTQTKKSILLNIKKLKEIESE